MFRYAFVKHFLYCACMMLLKKSNNWFFSWEKKKFLEREPRSMFILFSQVNYGVAWNKNVLWP